MDPFGSTLLLGLISYGMINYLEAVGYAMTLSDLRRWLKRSSRAGENRVLRRLPFRQTLTPTEQANVGI